jgi:hypothetical protein
MSNRKNYNSIVFLTVYLGLVLVGATPQVLAQAAMTRQFDIVTEIEFKDDLDKKPDGEQQTADYPSVSHGLYPLANEKENSKDFAFNYVVKALIDSTEASKCSRDSEVFCDNFLSFQQKVNKAFSHTFENDKQKVSVILPADNFLVKTKVFHSYNQQTETHNYFYSSALSKLKLQQINNAKALIYQNTFLPFENNQVFTVIRMPRASIDSLVARNA